MFPSIVADRVSNYIGLQETFCLPVTNAMIIMAISALVGYLLLSTAGVQSGLAFAGFFSLMTVATAPLIMLVARVFARHCCDYYPPEDKVSPLFLIAIYVGSIVTALIITFHIHNAIPSLPRMTTVQAITLSGHITWVFALINLLWYGFEKNYRARNDVQVEIRPASQTEIRGQSLTH